MGIFDRFKKKDRPQERSRDHHYYLAHYALRYVAHDDPLFFFAVLGSDESEKFLNHIFTNLCENVPDPAVQPHFGVEDLKIHRTRIGQYPVVTIEMPPALTMGEAYFATFVGLFDLSEAAGEKSEELRGRFFTLEVGQTLEGQARTVIGEWTHDESHLNYGTGPAPSLPEFLGAVEELLTGD
ncbi:MAG: hypothetical protein NXI24_23205 [bacterium]|nr:hypothetical protein [bacterium]